MSEADIRDPGERLIKALADDLRPVRRLPPPAVRALAWLALVAAAAVGLAAFADLHAVWRRLSAAPDMWLAVVGSTATMAAAAFAAFAVSLPDRSRLWALLPLPPLALWVAASGLGCLRAYVVPAAHIAAPAEMRDCVLFIVGVSAPLGAVLTIMLRRGFSLAPALTAALAGLASAAAAASLLNFFHPFDAAAADLAVHALVVAIVVAAASALGGRMLKNPFPGM